MADVTLYSRPDCHLCELAYALLVELGLDIVVTHIQSNPILTEKYSQTIPVVAFRDGAELNWPFDAKAIESRLIYSQN